MSATVELCESNGVGETVTHDIATSNYGSVDAPDLVPGDYPIAPSAGVLIGSFKKYQRLHVTALNGVSKVKNIKLWRSAGTPSGSDVHRTNAKTSAYSATAYATPATTLLGEQVMPTSEPASANIGIAGALAGELSAPGYSDYMVHQLQVHEDTTEGAELTLAWGWDEIS